MRLLPSLLLALSLLAPLAAEDEDRARLRRELPEALTQVAQAEAQLTGALAAAGIALPGAVSDALAVRRTIAQDWQRRLADDKATLDIATANQFHEDLNQLHSALAQLASAAQQSSSAPQQWPHCIDLPALGRFRDLLKRRIDEDLSGIAAGRSRSDEERGGDYRLQHRHQSLLAALEAGRSAGERFPLVPVELPLMREFSDYCRTAAGALEQAIARGDQPDQGDALLDQHQQVLGLYQELLQGEQTLRERQGDKRLAGSAALAGLVAVSAREAAAQRAMLALVRGRNPNDEDAWKREEEASRALERERALGYLVVTWCDQAGELADRRRELDERLADVPAAAKGRARTRIDALDSELAAADAAITKALAASDRLAVITANGEFGLVLRRFEREHQRIDEDAQWAEQEEHWQAKRSDPAVAAALKRFAGARQELAAKRAKAEEAQLAAARLRIEYEVLSARAELAEEQAQQLDQAAEEHQQALQEIANQLDEAAEQAPEEAVKPPPDANKF
jgi:hypothetical protein